MKNKQMKTIGMDLWSCTLSMKMLLRLVKRKGWQIYEPKQTESTVQFYAPIVQRNDIQRTLEHAERLKTTGMLGFFFRQMKRPRRILCISVSLIVWYVLSHTVFTITLQGDEEKMKQIITKALNDMGYTTPFFKQDVQDIKLKLKKKLENDIAWMEISKEGSIYHIQFTTKDFAIIEQLQRNELVAQKDGVIQRFEVQHGNKVVKLNQYVHKGDVLITNVIQDSSSIDQDLYVKGQVYAYTWKDVHVEMKKSNLPKPFAFYQLLFEARREASKNLRIHDQIYKENILQFQDNMGKISMDIHYTLIEDISTPK